MTRLVFGLSAVAFMIILMGTREGWKVSTERGTRHRFSAANIHKCRSACKWKLLSAGVAGNLGYVAQKSAAVARGDDPMVYCPPLMNKRPIAMCAAI